MAKHWYLNILFCVSCAVCASDRAHAFELYFERTIGLDAVDYKKRTNFISYNDVVLIDGAITSSPPDAVYYDRSFLTQTRFVSNLALKNNLSLRLQLASGNIIRKQEEAEEPRTLTMATHLYATPAAEFTYYTATGLEVVVGAKYHYINKFREIFETIETESVTKYEATGFLAPQAGVYKRAGFGTGGFYFSGKGEAKREVASYAFDGTENISEDVVYSPTVIGLVGRFKVAGYQTDAEFAAVQSGEGGNRTEVGDQVEEDHVRVRLATEIPLGRGALRLAAIHKTLSYASNAFVTLETIPMTTVHVKYALTGSTFSLIGGISYGEGFDVQSLPEFNAKYLLKTYGATLVGGLSF